MARAVPKPTPTRRRRMAGIPRRPYPRRRLRELVSRCRARGWTTQEIALQVFKLESDRTLYRWLAGRPIAAHARRLLGLPFRVTARHVRFVGAFSVVKSGKR